MYIFIYLFKLNLKIVYFFLKLIPVNSKKIVLMSRQTNTKSIDYILIEEDIKKRYPDYKLVILTKKLKKDFKSLINYYFHIYRQMYSLATSRVCLVDTYIIPVSILNHKKHLIIIQLCHGVGNIKKFGYQTLKKESGKNETVSKIMKMHCNYDYLISTSVETSKYYEEAFHMSSHQMLNFGPPKIDYILNINKKYNEVISKYPDIKDKPVILYVSTFRTYEDDYLEKFISSAPLDEYNVIIHIHPVAYRMHPNIDEIIKDDRIYRCKDIQTVDLLSVADYVVTDYSSFVFESAILEKPTYLFVPDYDKYTSKNGLNIDIFKELPKYVFKNSKDLFDSIKNKKYSKTTIRKFKEKYIENTNGDSTRRLVDFMISKTK